MYKHQVDKIFNDFFLSSLAFQDKSRLVAAINDQLLIYQISMKKAFFRLHEPITYHSYKEVYM